MAVAKRAQSRPVRKGFRRDDDRGGGIGDPVDELFEFTVVEQMRVVDHHCGIRIVAAARRPGEHCNPGCAQR